MQIDILIIFSCKKNSFLLCVVKEKYVNVKQTPFSALFRNNFDKQYKFACFDFSTNLEKRKQAKSN